MEELTRRTVRLPVRDMDAAIRAYYGTGYISNKEIREIFGGISPSTARKMKKPVEAEEDKRGVKIVIPHCINVKVAFDVWGIDIEEIEKNRAKLIKLGLKC